MINFKKYDSKNPQVWEKFVEIAKRAKARGFKHYSANGIFELMRWHSDTRGKGRYKISNNYRPDYARKMMQEYPEFKGFFRTCKLKAERP